MSAIILDLNPKLQLKKFIEAQVKKAEQERLEAERAIQGYLDQLTKRNEAALQTLPIVDFTVDYTIDFDITDK